MIEPTHRKEHHQGCTIEDHWKLQIDSLGALNDPQCGEAQATAAA